MDRERFSADRSGPIASAGYEPPSEDNEGVLEVEYRGGRVYRVFPFDASRYAEFVTAKSMGAFLNTCKDLTWTRVE